MRLWSLRSPYVPQTEKTVDMVHEIMELELPDSAELTDVLLDAQRGDAFAKTQVQLVQSEDVKDSAWSVGAERRMSRKPRRRWTWWYVNATTIRAPAIMAARRPFVDWVTSSTGRGDAKTSWSTSGVATSASA